MAKKKPHKNFEESAKSFLSKKWKVELEERKIKIGRIEKKFDLVSSDRKFVGDAKFYKNLKAPAAKFSTIAEYVWLLEKIKAKKRFLVFGNDREIPRRWVKRFGSLTKVEIYFLKNNKLEKLS